MNEFILTTKTKDTNIEVFCEDRQMGNMIVYDGKYIFIVRDDKRFWSSQEMEAVSELLHKLNKD